MTGTRRLLSVRDVCDRLRVGRSSFYRMVADGQAPPPVKVGHLARWPSDEIDALIESLVARRDRRTQA